ncbi:hypothetical protein EDB87DRAFT_1576041 [Lactarius vividus]|nr:hypothetical protein EDB87DRAFT_1576041 [Lactarius vividus]
MNYVPPSSFYDVFPNDYVNWNFVPPVGNFAGGAPAGTPRYGLQHPGGGGPARVPLTAPVFQAPTPVERVSSAGSPTAQSTISSQPTPSGPSTPSSQDMAQLFQEPDLDFSVSKVAPPTKRKAKGTGRPRGPNRRRPGSGYVDMMNALPVEVQNALQRKYANCCEVVRGKDPSTVQKHRFTRRHFDRIDPRYQGLLPGFTCPAFVGMYEKCKNAKYDSTERHCDKCPGFTEMRKKMGLTKLYPFGLSRDEFKAVRDFRKINSKADSDVSGPRPRRDGALEGHVGAAESQPQDVFEDAEFDEEQPSPSSSLPMDPSQSVHPQQLEQPFPAGPIYDFTGFGRASQVAVPGSWPHAAGTFAPGFLLPSQGLYPTNAGPSTWPNMDFDPAAFGTFF